MDIVDWYLKVFEDGINTKDLCIEMVKTKEINKTLQKKIEKLTSDYTAKISKLKEKLKSTKHYLVKQNQEVVKPLI